MERDKIFKYVNKNHQIVPENLWKKYPHYAVLRHSSNNKWYAIIMDVKKTILDFKNQVLKNIMDIKLDKDDILILQDKPGFLPAYHMNKTYWVSIRIGKVKTKEIIKLINASFELTK